MSKPDPVVTARQLIAERYPAATQAWLSGSVVLGHATATSDLDITVLFDDTEARRETLMFQGWLVEVFAHTETSIRRFVSRDTGRRRPSLARMISTGLPLLPAELGAHIRAECAVVVAAGPPPLSPAELDHVRYALTDQLDDLAGGATPAVLDAIATDAWRRCAELLLASTGRWSGTGKWLVRELEALDEAQCTTYTARLHDGLHAALNNDPAALITIADEILAKIGGRMSAGFQLTAPATT